VWSREHAAEAAVAPAAIWDLWADVQRCGDWNADIERIAIEGPFAVGSEITMTPRGADPVLLRIVAAEPGESFVDEASFEGLAIRTEHRIERLGGERVRVVYRTEIGGPAADEAGPEIGAAITDDFPVTIAALLETARQA
jgi:hypothetical protein